MPANRARSSQKAHKPSRVEKRSSNACVRCRTQKIKCSGTWPCAACQKRDLNCNLDESEQKIMVTKGYVRDLQQQIRDLERRRAIHHGDEIVRPENDDLEAVNSPQTMGRELTPVDDDFSSNADDDSAAESEPRNPRYRERSSRRRSAWTTMPSALTNPMSISASTYTAAKDGRPFSSEELLFDSSSYDLGWDGLRTSDEAGSPILPSVDHAMYLVSAVKFHCSQMFHLFDEASFMSEMRQFYADPLSRRTIPDLSHIHILLVIALGRAIVDKRSTSGRLPGTDIFVKAIRLLPNIHVLTDNPIQSTEILCCIALYFQSLDFRQSSYQFIGQAMRMALGFGMHTRMPVQRLGEDVVERCRKIFWTVYIMDREMTSLMGLPQSIDDASVQCLLPEFPSLPQQALTLKLRIRLSRIIATINSKIYGPDGQLHKKFLVNTKNALKDVAKISNEIQQSFPMQTDKGAVHGLSRVSAHIHLMCHQCIILATRPLLLCFLRIQLDFPDSYFSVLNSSETIWNFIKRCVGSSTQIINILTCLQSQGLLETFLPFDLESLFVATVNLVLGPALDARLQENSGSWLRKSYEIFDELSKGGNHVAGYRKAELLQLDDLLRNVPPRTEPPFSTQNERISRQDCMQPGVETVHPALATPQPSMQSSHVRSESFGDMDFGTGLTGAHILDLALSIENIDVDWMQQAGLDFLEW